MDTTATKLWRHARELDPTMTYLGPIVRGLVNCGIDLSAAIEHLNTLDARRRREAGPQLLSSERTG